MEINEEVEKKIAELQNQLETSKEETISWIMKGHQALQDKEKELMQALHKVTEYEQKFLGGLWKRLKTAISIIFGK